MGGTDRDSSGGGEVTALHLPDALLHGWGALQWALLS